MISTPLRPRSVILLVPLVVLAGFSAGFFLSGGGAIFFGPVHEATAAAVCGNGAAEAGETCSNCPYDVHCTATQKCEINDGTNKGECIGAGPYCEREDVCGDGWVSDEEACDDGGICKGSSNLSYEGEHCFDIDPTGNALAGVARCRATGGYCLAQGGDGCTANCQDECHPTDSPCLIDSDCCSGEVCVNGRCGTPPVCGNNILEGSEVCELPSYNTCTGGKTCVNCQCETVISGECSGIGGTCGGGCEISGDSWTITLTVPSGSSCSGGGNCSDLGGSSTVTYLGGGGCGYPPDPGVCDGWCWGTDVQACGADKWELAYQSGQYKLFADAVAVYAIDVSSWNCTGENTLTRIAANECAGELPLSVTITPVGFRGCE